MIRDLASKLWPHRLAATLAPPDAVLQTVPEIGFADEFDVAQGLAARVILYNDHYHSFDEVGVQIAKAIGCSVDDGEAIAWRVHTIGHAVVFDGDFIGCLHVSSVLEEIALNTQVMT
jgi:ATP-dependent Clp protease adaptor protein ClpS